MNIENADVLHLPGNTSDHCPIYCSFKINISPSSRTPITCNKSKPSWKKATDIQKDNYQTTLEQHLKNLECPSGAKHCKNVHCQSENHQTQIDEFLKDLLESINSAAVKCLPSASTITKNTKTRFSSWKENVQPFKDTAMFWHSIWLSAGRPLNTELHIIMKKTRNQYHYQIRKNRKMNDIKEKNRLLNACMNNNGDIFDEIKKLRKVHPTVSTMIDGVSYKIEPHFANTYRQLYNSIEDDHNLTHVAEHLSKAIDSNSHVYVDKITASLVKNAINHLKNNRNDPINDFTSDCLINAPFALSEQLSLLFRQFLIHGHASPILMVSTLLPMNKDKLISPFLYRIYIDDLLKILRKRRNGCWVNRHFVGIVGYADDLLLLAPCIDSLQDMVKSCEEYSASHNLTISTHSDIKKCKTKCMAFINKRRPLMHIKLNGKNLPWVDSSKHLGVRVGTCQKACLRI